MVKLLVVEDHALVREGLVQTLRQLKEKDTNVLEVSDFDGANRLLEQGHAGVAPVSWTEFRFL